MDITEIVKHPEFNPESSHIVRCGRVLHDSSYSQGFLFGGAMTKEEKAIHDKRYYQTHKIKILARAKMYRDTHQEEIVLYRQIHKKEKAACQAQHYRQNKEKMLLYTKQYRKANKSKIAAYGRKYQQSPKGKEIKRKADLTRRAKKAGIEAENFHPNEIFKRDNYMCQLCGKKTRPNLKNKYHPLYPNVDHIVPLSLGGIHTRKNTQCLCHQCNVIKCNVGKGDQLRMFG